MTWIDPLLALAVLAGRVLLAALYLLGRLVGILLIVGVVITVAEWWHGPTGPRLAVYGLGVVVGLWALHNYPLRPLQILAGAAGTAGLLFLLSGSIVLLSYVRTDDYPPPSWWWAYGLCLILAAAGLLWLALVALPKAIQRVIEQRRIHRELGKGMAEAIARFRNPMNESRQK